MRVGSGERDEGVLKGVSGYSVDTGVDKGVGIWSGVWSKVWTGFGVEVFFVRSTTKNGRRCIIVFTSKLSPRVANSTTTSVACLL